MGANVGFAPKKLGLENENWCWKMTDSDQKLPQEKNKAQNEAWLIAGLGNPGERYQNTRHNVGHAIADRLAVQIGEKWKRHKAETLVCSGRLGGPGISSSKIIVAKSLTYMNVSGGPLGRLAKYAGIGAGHILVVHDDLDLPAHELRLKRGGGEGGHNGLKSLSAVLQTRDYTRLRIGIGRPPGNMNPADFVLAQIPRRESVDWDITYQLAVDTIEAVVSRGFTIAQQELHSNK